MTKNFTASSTAIQIFYKNYTTSENEENQATEQKKSVMVIDSLCKM